MILLHYYAENLEVLDKARMQVSFPVRRFTHAFTQKLLLFLCYVVRECFNNATSKQTDINTKWIIIVNYSRRSHQGHNRM